MPVKGIELPNANYNKKENLKFNKSVITRRNLNIPNVFRYKTQLVLSKFKLGC